LILTVGRRANRRINSLIHEQHELIKAIHEMLQEQNRLTKNIDKMLRQGNNNSLE
jgi:NAD-dependent SIR2 family protein deacetylase